MVALLFGHHRIFLDEGQKDQAMLLDTSVRQIRTSLSSLVDRLGDPGALAFGRPPTNVAARYDDAACSAALSCPAGSIGYRVSPARRHRHEHIVAGAAII